MQERQITVDGETYPLPRPFLVLATQNPIELEGTFPSTVRRCGTSLKPTWQSITGNCRSGQTLLQRSRPRGSTSVEYGAAQLTPGLTCDITRSVPREVTAIPY